MKIRSLVIRPGGCFPTSPSRNDIRDPRYLVALIAGRYVTQANARENGYSATRETRTTTKTAVRVSDRAIQLSLSPALPQRGSTFTPAHDSARDPHRVCSSRGTGLVLSHRQALLVAKRDVTTCRNNALIPSRAPSRQLSSTSTVTRERRKVGD